MAAYMMEVTKLFLERIVELEATIDRMQSTIDDGVSLLEQANKCIGEQSALLAAAQTVAEERLAALRQRNTIIVIHQTKEQAQADMIIELRTQLVAAQRDQSTIVELRSALVESTSLLEQAHDRIAELEANQA